jgi:hypothetical protein
MGLGLVLGAVVEWYSTFPLSWTPTFGVQRRRTMADEVTVTLTREDLVIIRLALKSLRHLSPLGEKARRGALQRVERAESRIRVQALTTSTDFMDGIQRGVEAYKAGRIRPWEDVERDLFEPVKEENDG